MKGFETDWVGNEDFNYNASVFSVFLFPLLCLLPSAPSMMQVLRLGWQKASFPSVNLLLRTLGDVFQLESLESLL